MKITRAVIPTAGLGTRFLPATRVIPKILLPLLSTPTIDYAVRELSAEGITNIALIVPPESESIGEYFSEKAELVSVLEKRGSNNLAQQQKEISSLASVTTIVQRKPQGLGHAILLAKEWVGNEPFATVLPDDLVWGKSSAIAQLLRIHDKFGGQVIAGVETPEKILHTKGVIGGTVQADGVLRVTELVEKPPRGRAPSNLAIVGRYIFEPSIFTSLEQTGTGAIEEIQITDAIMTANEVTRAVILQGRHIDVGNPLGMLTAAIHEASRDSTMRSVILQELERL